MQKYQNNVQTRKGVAVRGASVYVYNADGSLATLYSDNGVTLTTNPVITGPDGEYWFYVENGRYSLTVVASGYVIDKITDFSVQDVGDLLSAATLALSAAQLAVLGVQEDLAAVADSVNIAVDSSQAAQVSALAALGHSADAAESEYNAAVSKDSALAAKVATDRIYPGSFATDPLLRPDGTARQVGDMAFNSTSALWKRWSGSAWIASDINTANLAASGGAGLVGWIQFGTNAVFRWVYEKLFEIPSLLDYIPRAEHAAIKAGTSTYDCTAGIVAALVAHDVVRAMPGLYNVSSFSIGAGKRLTADGAGVIFQQIAGQAVGTRVIKITGSNTFLGDCTVRGNIATDTDEQNHAVFIQANATTGSLNNILIGNIRGENIRGDVVYFGQANGGAYKLTNVNIGHVTFDNVYRNGVSCVSAIGWSVLSVTGTRCGFMHMDVEANVNSGICADGFVGYIKGRHFGLVCPIYTDYVDSVEVRVLDLSPAHAAQSVPSYPQGLTTKDGLMLRNVKRAKIGHLKIVGFDRFAITTVFNSGELGCEHLEIGSLYMRTCSLTDTVYNSYVQTGITRLTIGYLDVEILQTAKRAFDSLSNSRIGNVNANIQANSVLMRSCTDCMLGYVMQSGVGGFLLQNCNRIAVKGGSFTGDRLATSSDKCTFENFTATAAVFLFSSGQEDHTILNSTLNGDFYSFGTGLRSYLHTMRFGAYQVWIDAGGRLRRKGGVPSSDTDGVIIGTATKGTTAARPVLTTTDIGVMYLDTTLAAAGKPITWTGTVWVDSLGASV